MEPEVYTIAYTLLTTVTLRQGEKKHYNNKVDAYNFAIVLWELLHNKLLFEGMSNFQAAYAAAFKNVRPNAHNLPEKMSTVLTSYWQKDLNTRPNFTQIIQMLFFYLASISPPQHAIPSRLAKPTVNTTLESESPGTSSLMATHHESNETPKVKMESKPRGLLFPFLGQLFMSSTL
ncbi:hypothetical protein QQ045_000400 [Rhodiola kirilowii]